MKRFRGPTAAPVQPGTRSPGPVRRGAPDPRTADVPGASRVPVVGIAAAGMTALVGWLVVIEFVSGIIQGY
ncbi:hypothetical protein [Actinomyces provencensis]|uniref:hypothetical protein n=1 Tax=Actinomyces provencensis TaxID=1720198 RepID=UPI001E42820B|nr:hypothetical protein [Actinomyces provencensis]